MPALPPNTPDVWRASASRLLDALEDSVTGKDRRAAIIGDLADVLEELFVRALVDGLAEVIGEPPIDPVTRKPLAVWPVVRDLRTRVERAEDRADNAHGRIDHATDGLRARVEQAEERTSAALGRIERRIEDVAGDVRDLERKA